MAALSADRQTPHRPGQISRHPVAASTKIFKGSLVMLNSAGFAVPGADTAGCTFAGVARHAVDNSTGSNGDLFIEVDTQGLFLFAKAGTINQAQVGIDAFLSDDQTVADAATTLNDVLAGRIEELEGSQVWLRLKV